MKRQNSAPIWTGGNPNPKRKRGMKRGFSLTLRVMVGPIPTAVQLIFESLPRSFCWSRAWLVLLAAVVTAGWGDTAVAQDPPPAAAEKQDPATPSDIITQTLLTIRGVDNLNRYIEENKSLVTENQTLKQQLASLNAEVAKLTKMVQAQTEQLKTPLLTLPEFKIKSKVVGNGGGQAILEIDGKSIRIRENVKMSLPLPNGVWALIQVQKISKDMVEINFLELNRVVTIYD